MNETNYSVKSASSCPVKFLLAKKDIICCSKCPFIPFIELKEKDNNIIVSLICQNQHKEEKDIYTFLNDIKNIRPNKNTCEKCNQLQNNKTNPISYCLNCNFMGDFFKVFFCNFFYEINADALILKEILILIV